MPAKDISTTPAGSLIPLTSSARLVCTHHLSDPAVQPGQLDIVLVPGPDPATNYDGLKDATDWLAAHAARPETDILSVCTGIYLCGAAGLLKGKKACGPRGLQGDLAKRFEGVQWLGEELRWVRDGNLWSSGECLTRAGYDGPGVPFLFFPCRRRTSLTCQLGGVTNGNDLVAAYARLSGRFAGPVVEFGLVMTDTGDRPQSYGTGKAVFTLRVVWQILKAIVIGKKKVV
jgi:hypothetical protein